MWILKFNMLREFFKRLIFRFTAFSRSFLLAMQLAWYSCIPAELCPQWMIIQNIVNGQKLRDISCKLTVCVCTCILLNFRPATSHPLFAELHDVIAWNRSEAPLPPHPPQQSRRKRENSEHAGVGLPGRPRLDRPYSCHQTGGWATAWYILGSGL